MSKTVKALLASYGRSVLGAATTLYLAGVTDPVDLGYSLLGAILPVAIRYVNPNDTAFGRIPKAEELAEALKNVTPVKAPAGKTAPVTSKEATKPVAKKPTTKK